MITFGAYDAGAPCKNTSCKSHGKPHPNCKCYPNMMAEGGLIEHYCMTQKAHRRDCKYFADGGEVHPLDIPQHPDPQQAVASFLAHGGLQNLLKMDSNFSIDALDDYNRGIAKGHKAVNARIKDLFDGKKSEAADVEKPKKLINDWIDKGGITHDIQQELYKQNTEPMGFASGGEVKKLPHGILHENIVHKVYPDHNPILGEAKGRMSNYLNGLKPNDNTPRLAFDKKPDSRKQKKDYNDAVHIAAHPLHMVDEIQKGTVRPEHVRHFKNLHPEIDNMLQKKLAERISVAQLKGEKPSFKVRQGLSLYLGVPLMGELAPQNIMAAQAVFQTQAAKKQAGGQPTPRASQVKPKEAEDFLTPQQAAAKRQQKQ